MTSLKRERKWSKIARDRDWKILHIKLSQVRNLSSTLIISAVQSLPPHASAQHLLQRREVAKKCINMIWDKGMESALKMTMLMYNAECGNAEQTARPSLSLMKVGLLLVLLIVINCSKRSRLTNVVDVQCTTILSKYYLACSCQS